MKGQDMFNINQGFFWFINFNACNLLNELIKLAVLLSNTNLAGLKGFFFTKNNQEEGETMEKNSKIVMRTIISIENKEYDNFICPIVLWI